MPEVDQSGDMSFQTRFTGASTPSPARVNPYSVFKLPDTTTTAKSANIRFHGLPTNQNPGYSQGTNDNPGPAANQKWENHPVTNQGSGDNFPASGQKVEIPNLFEQLNYSEDINEYHTDLRLTSISTLLDILLNSKGKVTLTVD